MPSCDFGGVCSCFRCRKCQYCRQRKLYNTVICENKDCSGNRRILSQAHRDDINKRLRILAINEKTITFGKYKGSKLSTLNKKYLTWVSQHITNRPLLIKDIRLFKHINIFFEFILKKHKYIV